MFEACPTSTFANVSEAGHESRATLGGSIVCLVWGRMGSGGPPGLQNRVRAGSASLSEFDSHALPPADVCTLQV